MKLLDILKVDAIIPGLTAKHKKEVLEELCRPVAKREGIERGSLLEVLLEREKLGSTGIGEGVAIPHGKTKAVKELLIACGRSHSGVDFESMDGKPTNLFFLLIAPENSTGIHLKALAKISRMLKDPSFRQEFMSAQTAEKMLDVIASRDTEF